MYKYLRVELWITDLWTTLLILYHF